MREGLRTRLLTRRPIEGVRVVDAHACLGAYSQFFIPEPDALAMVRVMDRCGVGMACIASHVTQARRQPRDLGDRSHSPQPLP
jgi:hypothetical protein